MNAQAYHRAQSLGNPIGSDKVDWYVYYRVRVEYADSLQMRVASMHDRMFREFGIMGTLKRRPQPQQGLHTWMEIYTAVPDAFEAILAAAVMTNNLSELVDGERHTEHFLDVTCA